MNSGNKSEVARLKKQIEDECEAGKNALRFTPVAQHKHITRGMERMWNDFERLRIVAGEEEAEKFLKRL